MKILYIYREKEKNEHSIEAVFDTVAMEMQKLGHDVHKWYKPVSLKSSIKEIIELRKQKYDLYHITGDVNYLWVFFPWKKTTMTIHDIGFYKNHPINFVSLVLVLAIIVSSWFLKRITCVSELTKRDLNQILHIREKWMVVINNPLSLPVKRNEKAFRKDCPKILQIGTGDHKNLIGLIEAAKGIKCYIEIVGNPSENLRQKMEDYGEHYTISYRISVEEIVKKYEQCDILYFVSKSEGFGMPIIEAQTVGRPVITTNTEPTSSVAGNAAILCDANDYEAIRSGLIKLINNQSLRHELISRGFENARKYNPSHIAKHYENFYCETFGL